MMNGGRDYFSAGSLQSQRYTLFAQSGCVAGSCIHIMLACSRRPLFLLWLSDWKTVTTSVSAAPRRSIPHFISSSLLPHCHTHTHITLSYAPSAPMRFKGEEKVKIVELRGAADWYDKDPRLQHPFERPLSFENIALTFMDHRNDTVNITADDVRKEYETIRRCFDNREYGHSQVIDLIQDATDEHNARLRERQSRADPEPRAHAHGSRTRHRSRAPSHAPSSSTYTAERVYNPGPRVPPTFVPGTLPPDKTPGHAPSSSTHNGCAGCYPHSGYQPGTFAPGTCCQGPASTYAPNSSTYAGWGETYPSYEYIPATDEPRTGHHNRAASQAPSSSTYPRPAYYPDSQPGGSQALVLATHEQPPPSTYAGSTYHPDREPEAGQAVVVALNPAQMQLATRTTSWPRRTSGFDPRVPPPDGQMTLPYWLAGSHRSLSSIWRRRR